MKQRSLNVARKTLTCSEPVSGREIVLPDPLRTPRLHRPAQDAATVEDVLSRTVAVIPSHDQGRFLDGLVPRFTDTQQSSVDMDLLDNPPVLPVADATARAATVDGVPPGVEASHTRRVCIALCAGAEIK